MGLGESNKRAQSPASDDFYRSNHEVRSGPEVGQNRIYYDLLFVFLAIKLLRALFFVLFVFFSLCDSLRQDRIGSEGNSVCRSSSLLAPIEYYSTL